jgi:hypothetical protein
VGKPFPFTVIKIENGIKTGKTNFLSGYLSFLEIRIDRSPMIERTLTHYGRIDSHSLRRRHAAPALKQPIPAVRNNHISPFCFSFRALINYDDCPLNKIIP